MENKQFESDNLNLSPRLNQGFLPDKFAKKMNQLNIPDTIIENCSGELSGDSLKMEASKMTEIFNNDDKENISINQQLLSNISLNSSKNFAIDNSFLRQCERKLLESSNSSEEINEPHNISTVNSQLLKIKEKFNDTVSTPPSSLRKEISQLKSELAEAHEFHDFEIELLKEEKFLNEADPETYLELFEKYSALMELYTTLKTEYEQYRKAQEKIGHELQSKTADCLESLCSQIEASDNSLNFSSASFVSFNGGIRSSTMMEDMSEVEATVVHDATILANDPLSITTDGVFKTPMQTPLKKELFPQEMSLNASKPTVKEVKGTIGKLDTSAPLDSECNIQLLNLETALYDKVKEVKDLEERLLKMEEMSLVLQNEFERISSGYAKENNSLKESLSAKTEQLDILTQKLFTETISLNPSLKDSLIDVPGEKLLLVFIENIMENCKKIKGADEMKTIENLKNQLASQEAKLAELEDLRKTCENLETKLSDAESTVLIRDEEIRMLQSHASNFRQTREELASTKEALHELESRLAIEDAEKKKQLDELRAEKEACVLEKREIELELKRTCSNLEMKFSEVEKIISQREEEVRVLQLDLYSTEAKKAEAENRSRELEEFIETLKQEIDTKEKSQLELENRLSSAEEKTSELESENIRLRESYDSVKVRMTELEDAYSQKQEEIRVLKSNEEKKSAELEELRKSFESLESKLSKANSTISALEEEIQTLRTDLAQTQENFASAKTTLTEYESQLLLIETQRTDAENRNRELEKTIENLQLENTNIRKEFETQKSKIESENNLLKQSLEDLKVKMNETENAVVTREREVLELRAVENQLTSVKESLATADETILKLKTQLESVQMEKSEMENRCSELQENNQNLRVEINTAKNLEKNPVYEKIQTENGDLKERILESEKMMAELKAELELAKENQMNNICKVEELIREIEELKRENYGFSCALNTIEEIQKNLADVLTAPENDSDMPSDRITKLIEKTSKLPGEGDTRETRILSDFVDTITKTCKGVQNELIKKFDSKKVEWESQKDFDLQNLQDHIKELNMKNTEHEAELKRTKYELTESDETIIKLKSQLTTIEVERVEIELWCRKLEENTLSLQAEIDTKETVIKEFETLKSKIESENNLLKQSLEDLKVQMSEMENAVVTREEEILELKAFEHQLTSVKENLATADETILKLKTQLQIVQMEKSEMENRCSELQENNQNLRVEINTAKNLEKNPIYEKIQTENDDLKKRILESEKMMAELKAELDLAKENQMNNICKVEELIREIEELKRENNQFSSALNTIEEIQKNLADVLTCPENASDMPSDRITKLIQKTSKIPGEGDTRETRILSDFVDSITKTCKGVQNELIKKFDSKKLEWESQKDFDLQNLQDHITELNKKNTEHEAALKRTKHELTEADETIMKLKSQLTSMEVERVEIELRCRKLEENTLSLQAEIDTKETVIKEFETLKSKIESENNLLKQSLEDLKIKMSETENTVVTREQEILELRAVENQLTSVKENLATADETILKLKTQLESVQMEKSEMENRCSELQENNQNLRVEINTAKNLENNPIYEKIQTENGDLKDRILESEKMMAELKAELDLAKENQMNNICKVEELIREIEELKRENNGFSSALNTIEETQKNLADVLTCSANDSDMPSDRITKLIEKTSKLPGEGDTRETRILSDFVDTITKTCKGVQNELIKKFDSKKLEWESQKDFDLQNLQDHIKELNKKNSEHEAALKRTKHELTEADETIMKLKSQLTSTEVEKVEIELRCRKLEENNLDLQAEIDTKETVIKGLDELKIVRLKIENENGDLKKKVLESEEVIVRLKKNLEIVKEEQIARDIKIKDSQIEIDLLKNEKEVLVGLTKKLEDVEKNNRHLMDVISEVQTHLDIPEGTLKKILSGNSENRKMFSEKINHVIKTEKEELKSENKHLKLGIDNLKEKVKQLTRLIGESACDDEKEDISNLNVSNSLGLKNKRTSRRSDLCVRRLDKLEEINHNLTELITRVLTMTEFPDPDKLKLYSVRDFPNAMKKVLAHLNTFLTNMKEENAQLDEECETYSNIIKDLKKEAAAAWKTNMEKTEAMEGEISRLKEEKNCLENEKQDLLGKISKLEEDCRKLKSSRSEATPHNCICGNESKKINELKRTLLIKEQKLLELQDLETQTNSYKSQIEYLKNALEREKKKIGEEKEKNKKLRNDLNEATKNQKPEENQVLDELRMRGSLSGGIVQEFVDKEKMKKLAKDIGILKELCRARYAEIKRLEAVNAALRNAATPKNSNQMDSPIRTRGYNTRSKIQARDIWKTEINGKENSAL